MTEQSQQTKIPPPPKPRPDIQTRVGVAPEEHAEWLEFLAAEPVDAWRDQDGMIYLRRMPAEMAPNGAMVDSPTYIAPDSPSYEKWLSHVEPEYDFMEPTPATPEPRTEEETPDAASPDDDAEA